jgi:hypothetical protein
LSFGLTNAPRTFLAVMNRIFGRYLGKLVLDKTESQVDPRKIEIVAKWTRPKDVSQLRSLLGLCNYFRRFSQSYLTLVAPLTHLTREDIKFT